MIFNKKKSFFEKKLSKSIGKLKDLLKALKSLGLPNWSVFYGIWTKCGDLRSVIGLQTYTKHTNRKYKIRKNYLCGKS